MKVEWLSGYKVPDFGGESFDSSSDSVECHLRVKLALQGDNITFAIVSNAFGALKANTFNLYRG